MAITNFLTMLYCISCRILSFIDFRIKKQCPYEPGSVSVFLQRLSFIYCMSHPMPLAFYPPPHPRKELGQATLNRWYTRTCSLQMEQPTCHHAVGGLLPHLLTLTSNGTIPMKGRTLPEAVVFFFRHLPSPIASILGSGAPCAARTFLFSHKGTSDRPGHCFLSFYLWFSR